MASPSKLYRFRIELSDLDRTVYETLDFRVAMHPSETTEFLLTRVLAYALNFTQSLEFSQGLSTPDEPAIKLLGEHGAIELAIEIGNPSAKRLHKISKASKKVRVYTYKDPQNLKREVAGESVHRAAEIEVFSFSSPILTALAHTLDRDNEWILVHNESQLMITVNEQSLESTVDVHSLI